MNSFLCCDEVVCHIPHLIFTHTRACAPPLNKQANILFVCCLYVFIFIFCLFTGTSLIIAVDGRRSGSTSGKMTGLELIVKASAGHEESKLVFTITSHHRKTALEWLKALKKVRCIQVVGRFSKLLSYHQVHSSYLGGGGGFPPGDYDQVSIRVHVGRHLHVYN